MCPGILSPCPTWPNIFTIVQDRNKFSNREQSETNRNDGYAMCDYSSEYLRMCFRLYEDSPRPFLNIVRTLVNEARKVRINKTKREQFPKNRVYENISKYYMDNTDFFSTY